MHVFISGLSRFHDPSGLCRHAANLALCLAGCAEVSRVTLAVGSWQEEYFRTTFGVSHPKLETLSVGCGSDSAARNRWYLFGLPRLVNKYSPDVVHLAFPSPFFRDRFRCPVVSTIHDLYPYDLPENFGFPRVFLNRLFLRVCFRNSDRLVCVSDFTLARLKEVAPEVAAKKATRIYNCVTLSTAGEPPLADGMEQRPFLLTVAQHRKNKNLQLLVRTFAQLRSSQSIDPDTALVVVGTDGPETAEIKKLITTLSLEQNTILLRAITDTELAWLYSKCALFVSPSSIEGFCLPLVEALRFGCRVLCSDIAVLREIAGSACRYFDLTSLSPETTLAEGIVAALQQPRFSCDEALRFRLEVVGPQWVGLYSSLLRTAAANVTSAYDTQEAGYAQ